MVPEGFSGKNVCEMYLNKWNIDGQESISDGDACMSVCSGIDDDGIHIFFGRLVNFVDQISFVVALEADQFNAVRSTFLVKFVFNLF